MSDTKHGPLQDPINLTPFDLLMHGIEIVEQVPNYFRFRTVANDKVGALHDTPAQAIQSARRCFGVWEDEGK